MNRENQLIIDFRDYRRDGKGRRVKSSSLSIFYIVYYNLKIYNLLLTKPFS